MIAAPSPLYEAGSKPALLAAMDWITGTLFGSAATALCIIAVALIGLMMLTGRLPLRQGLRTIVGCFVLLGAPVIAAGLMGSFDAASPREIVVPPLEPGSALAPRKDLPPATYDPYAGASLRNDG